ncbi:DNA alkylation repair protein [Sphingobacterium spiritivorum]|uniref:DNA alkylation repair protein n=1 Tax=Sphingobacterium spiritivorum TaxID=258 RepID=UPI00191B8057|nr:DNA alkylation repair protein [Sphingobacterium spiritivorum]QQT26703.1 DNA alkylation repair protein [Sphingobacterium spiritivorum]
MQEFDFIQRIIKTEHGFKPFEDEASRIFRSYSLEDSKNTALELLHHDFCQVRSVGIFILGFIASEDKAVLSVLKECARNDESWQVQEIIAKAFDQFCRDNGYEHSLPEIKQWLGEKHPNICRAVTEGLRIWTSRPYFKEHPQEAIRLISLHNASDSEYLRKSVGNSLRDIHKKYPEYVESEISQWDLSDDRIAHTYKFVLRKQ